MKTVSAALAQHLAGEMTTLATCWKITRCDGVVLGFTDHVRDLEVGGVTYRAATLSLSALYPIQAGDAFVISCPTAPSGCRWEITGGIEGAPAASQVILRYVATRV